MGDKNPKHPPKKKKQTAKVNVSNAVKDESENSSSSKKSKRNVYE